MIQKQEMRAAIAAAVLVLPTYVLGRFLGRYDLHWAAIAAGYCTTFAVAGAIVGGRRGALLGTGTGLVIGLLLVPLEVFLWLEFSLPPHPQYDL